MDPVPIGYFPKRRTRRQGWVSPWPEHPAAGFPCPPPVEELCSSSHCIARGPDRITGEVGPTGGYPDPAAA